MAWFRVDDKLGDHPKVRAIPRTRRRNAMGLWLLAGVWCASNVTTTEGQDGNVPAYMVDDLGCEPDDAADLVRVALWHAAGHDCPDCEQPRDPAGFIFHEWASLQYTREQILEKRAADAERQRASRARRREEKQSPSRHTVTSSDDPVSHGTVQEPRPVPTRPPADYVRGQRSETLPLVDVTEPLERPEDARCTTHAGVLEPGPCRGCMNARKRAETLAANERAMADRLRQNCTRCGGAIWIEPIDGGPMVKCDHRPPLEVVK